MVQHMTPHEMLQKELQDLTEEDLQQMLLEDPLVQSVLKAVPEQDRARIEKFVVDFVDGWKQGAINPIIEMAKDPEFVKAFMKVMLERDPGAGDLSGIL